MKLLIIGAGAIGSTFGGFLSEKNDVTVIGRDPHIGMINKNGLYISGIWGEHRFSKPKALTSISEIPKNSTFDLIMITTKSYDTQTAVEEISQFVGKDTAVMSMQNGIGNEDTISAIVGKRNTMGGMAIFGARLKEPGHVEVTVYASECLVGDIMKNSSDRANEIVDTFTQAGIPTKHSDNIIRDKWMKAFYNIALNPLSAILRVPYGELGKREETKNLMKTLLKEAFIVAEAFDIPLEQNWEEYFRYLLEKQLPPTSAHRSSMLQDIERGKKTEIDYLNGAIASIGALKGVETPVNSTITDIIKALEKRE